MGLGGLLDAKALAPEALWPTAFEPSVGEVSEARKIFGTFVLPELEIPLAQKSSSELIDASDVAITKVYRIFSYIDRKKTWYFTNLYLTFQVLLLSRAQRKQAEKSEARARSAQAQIDLLQKRAKKAEGQKREMSRCAKDAELRLEWLETELDALRSAKGIADSEVSCLRQNLQSS